MSNKQKTNPVPKSIERKIEKITKNDNFSKVSKDVALWALEQAEKKNPKKTSK